MMDYAYLPDRMTPEELRPLFYGILNQIDWEGEDGMVFALDQLYELSLRQVYTYVPVEAELKHQVSQFVLKHMDPESIDRMDVILAIIPLLELEDVYGQMLKCLPTIRNPEVVALIQRCRSDYGGHFSDVPEK